jgi:hypothetical protein
VQDLGRCFCIRAIVEALTRGWLEVELVRKTHVLPAAPTGPPTGVTERPACLATTTRHLGTNQGVLVVPTRLTFPPTRAPLHSAGAVNVLRMRQPLMSPRA